MHAYTPSRQEEQAGRAGVQSHLGTYHIRSNPGMHEIVSNKQKPLKITTLNFLAILLITQSLWQMEMGARDGIWILASSVER